MNAETGVKQKEMTFRGYYDSLPPQERKSPKKEFVAEIAILCKCAESTVRAWLSGTQQPDPLKRSIIAEYLKKPEETLFPKE